MKERRWYGKKRGCRLVIVGRWLDNEMRCESSQSIISRKGRYLGSWFGISLAIHIWEFKEASGEARSVDVILRGIGGEIVRRSLSEGVDSKWWKLSQQWEISKARWVAVAGCGWIGDEWDSKI
jgi:hypothetical protein